MREIRFRGWHSAQKIMFSAETMAEDQLTLLPTGNFINVHSVSTKLSEIYSQDIFIPLQFTGLKDKNSKEIYEGDIVKLYIYGSERIAEIWFDEGSFWVGNGKDKVGNTVGFNFLISSQIANIEIIGNIYENSELIKE